MQDSGLLTMGKMVNYCQSENSISGITIPYSSGNGTARELLSAAFYGIDSKDGVIILGYRHDFCTDYENMGLHL